MLPSESLIPAWSNKPTWSPGSYVDIESFADRLLAFKENSVQIVNVASATDTGWFLVENLKYHGIRHPAASTKTEYGIVWINDGGCYLYDGRRVRNLIDNKSPNHSVDTF